MGCVDFVPQGGGEDWEMQGGGGRSGRVHACLLHTKKKAVGRREASKERRRRDRGGGGWRGWRSECEC